MDIKEEKEFYRIKLLELEYMKKELILAETSDEVITEMNVMIDYIKKEYKKVVMREKKEGKTK